MGPLVLALVPTLAQAALGFLFRPKPKTGINMGQLKQDAKKAGLNTSFVLSVTGGAPWARRTDTTFFDTVLSGVGSALSAGLGALYSKTPAQYAPDGGYKSGGPAYNGGGYPSTVGPTVGSAPVVAGAAGSSLGQGVVTLGSGVVPTMVATMGADGIVRQGPNPQGPDADQALYALFANQYYLTSNRLASNEYGTPLTNDGTWLAAMPQSAPKGPAGAPVYPSANPWPSIGVMVGDAISGKSWMGPFYSSKSVSPVFDGKWNYE